MKDESLLGKKFGRLTVVSIASRDTNGYMRYKCECECGTLKVIRKGALLNNRTKSCGCLMRDIAREKATNHGKSGTKIYSIWQNIKYRCNNKNATEFHRYGGRGIKYDHTWDQFENFYKDMGDLPKDSCQIDRIDNNGNYSKDNCRWATRSENSRNTRRSRFWFINGVRYETSREAAKKTGLTQWKVEDRCHKNKDGCSTYLKYT